VAGAPSEHLDIEQALCGLLAVAIAEREERLGTGGPTRRTEVVLADAGLSYGAIASLTGKKRDSVRKSVERARKGGGNE
jgi:DNA-directed RNA polymerase specialized sigma24 family protein